MSKFVIVDTDVLIDTSHDIPDAIACLQQLEQQSTIAISAITEMELIVGCGNKKRITNT